MLELGKPQSVMLVKFIYVRICLSSSVYSHITIESLGLSIQFVDGNTLNRVWLELDYRLDVWPFMILTAGNVINLNKLRTF